MFHSVYLVGRLVALLSAALLFSRAALAQTPGVGIGTTTPDASAALDIRATGQGVLVPRLTAAQRTGIAAPATGLLVYQTDAPAGFWYNAGTPAAPAWTIIGPGAAGTNWLLSGNANSDSTADYLGTTDARPLRLGTGGVEQARLHPNGAFWLGGLPRSNPYGIPSNHLLLGYQAGKLLDSSASGSHFVGYQAGLHTTTGNYNHFEGLQAGYATTTGNYNHFEGFRAGYANTLGSYNQVAGYQAGYSNTTGRENLFVGYQSGYANTTGFQNHFNGYGSGYSNTTGGSNQFEGYKAGYANTTGSSNLFSGFLSGLSNTTGNSNQFVGNESGFRTPAEGHRTQHHQA